MLDQNQIDAVVAQVQEFTADRKMFTAWDVTSNLRHAGTQVKHYEVRGTIHGMFPNPPFGSDYDRMNVDVGNGQQAWLYFPDDQDPNTYDRHANQPTTVAQDPASNGYSSTDPVPSTDPASSGDGPPAPDSTVSSVVSTNKNGRLHIKAQYLRGIGLGAGQNAVVYPAGTELHITAVSSEALAKTNARMYRIGSKQGFEIRPIVVRQITSGDTFRFVIKGGEIVVTA
jgi:hypothetical protein